MKQRFNNLLRVIRSWPSMLVGLLLGGGFRLLIEYFSDRSLIAGNYGVHYATTNFIFDLLGAVFIVIFAASIIYKTITFSSTQHTNSRGAIGGFLAALVGGCAACSMTLAVYLGLGAFLTIMPYGGLEIKILGILILIRSAVRNIRDLLICKVKK